MDNARSLELDITRDMIFKFDLILQHFWSYDYARNGMSFIPNCLPPFKETECQ